jgi:hypothetical protein
MKIDRCYILLGQFNMVFNQDGSQFYDIDLREIMSSLYDKYTRFSIKLEAYHSRTANAAGLLGDEVQFLHMSGLNWLNGYDTNPLYPSSRVAAVLFFEHLLLGLTGEFYRSILYPSNIATTMFSRQASSRIRLELFATIPDNDVKLAALFGNELPNYLFSITGVEDSYPIYRQPEIIEQTSQLVLNASKATNLEAFRRAIRWQVDLSQVIDRNAYNKYNKFALITKMAQTNNTYANFSAWVGNTALMSGLNWFSPSVKLNSTYTGTTSWLNLYHQGAVSAVSLLDYTNFDLTKETFIENVFYKPASPVVDLTITFNRVSDLNLIGSSQAIEPFVWFFQIIPVD